MPTIRTAMAQCNAVVGGLDANAGAILEMIGQAERSGCDLVAFPELMLTGYPPEDLLLKAGFVDRNLELLSELAARTSRCAAIIGFVDRIGTDLANAVAICAEGEIRGVYHKRRLPNYAVFDEQRYFSPGREPLELFGIGGVRVAATICEDAWWPGGPIEELATGGAELVINVNGSPYHRNKVTLREQMLAERAAQAGCPIVYVNLVGGQDELVFDGCSVVVDAEGQVVARAPQYEETLWVTDVEIEPRRDVAHLLPVRELVHPSTSHRGGPARPVIAELLDPHEEVYRALQLGLADYVTKNGFAEVVVGLSGGIDSSLVAALSVDALGADAVHGVLMPSRFSSDHSVTDAEALSENLGIDHRTIAIEKAHEALLTLLEPSFAGRAPDLAEQNLQARIRGVLLMALSNKLGWLVITTSNKSESAVGFSTLYGDSAGGFAVIKDVPKLLVFELCRWRNRHAGREIIPANVLTKPPSAELAPDQRDDQTLPPYEVLDPILEAYVEQDRTARELVEAGFDPDLVARVTRLVDANEYKRRQSPPGPRITTKAFGKDRRLPITNGFRG